MQTLRRLLTYIWPYRRRLVVSIVCGMAVSGATVLATLLVKPVLDEIFIQRDTGKLLLFPVVIFLLYLARGLFYYGHAYYLRWIGQRVMRDLRDQLFGQMQGMSLAYFHRHHTGTLMSRITNDVLLIEQAVSNAVNDLFRQSLTMIGLIGVAFYRDWFLAMLTVLGLPLASLPLVLLGRRVRRINRGMQEQMERLSTLLEEVFSGIKIVKGFGREPYERTRFQQRNAEYYRMGMRAVRTGELGSPIMDCIGAFGIATVVFYGGRQVIAGVTTPGTFFSFIAAILMIYEPLRKLSRINNTIQRALAAADRIFAVLDTAGEWQDETGKPELPVLRQRLVFSDVSLRYRPREPLVLRGITLEIRAGEVVALVGMSGAGKTSLVELLLRFYRPVSGRITIDGVDIWDVSLASLRAQIGMVSQDIVLFDDTVRQNILYGHLEASHEEVVFAARAAYAHEFIMALPQGYDTLIGERGIRLSGGEKQRLAIARALLRNPPLLILDEATSSLDSASERMVQYALDNLMKDRTTLVIAHRLSTVRHADKIAVLDAGVIVEVGRHDELLERGGIYRRLCEVQFRTRTERRSDGHHPPSSR
jgi:subfamily B ATP-binding cassette protein MsbA